MFYKEKLNKNDICDILSLSPMQESMLFSYLSSENTELYFEQLSINMNGILDIKIFKETWNYIIDKNEALRTIFRWEEVSKPVQIVLKKHIPEVNYYDLSDISSESRRQKVQGIKNNDRKRKFDIKGETIRINVCKLEENNYEMIISNHHILYDGWSNGIILNEFFETYNSLFNKKNPNISNKGKFKDFILYCNSQDKAKQEQYWENYLIGMNENSGFYSDIQINEVEEEKAEYDYKLDKDLMEKLNKTIRNEKITLASVIYAAWGIILQRYNNSNDVLFGTTTSGRPSCINGIENIVGLFINTIPLRVNISQDNSLLDLIKAIEKDLRDRDEFENTPIEDIKKYSNKVGIKKLINSIVIIENYPIDIQSRKNLKDILTINKYSMFEINNFDITLTVIVFDGISLKISYNKSKYDKKFINRLMNQIVTIIKEITVNTKEQLKEVSILDDSEKQELINNFNTSKVNYDNYLTIDELFKRQAKLTPENTALIFEDNHITYKELDEKSDKLAEILMEKGVKKDNIVALAVEPSFDIVIGMLGILKSGATYLPIDLEYPSERINYMLSDSNTKIVVTQNRLINRLNSIEDIICIDEIEYESKECKEIRNISQINNLAYLIYTSGSTGKPKGVMIEHKSVFNFMKGIIRKTQFNENDKIVALTTISFDISLLELLLPLTIGMKIIIANRNEQIDPVKLGDLLVKNKVNTLQITPSRLQLLITQDNSLNIFNNLEKLIVGGERLTEKLYYALKKLRNTKIFNAYGPTETTIWSTITQVNTEKEENDIGQVINNTEIIIINNEGKIQPIGAIGEICIAGDGLARGYLNREEITREKFINSIELNNKRLYKSGDLGRWTEDGKLKFYGRIDNQVKFRGFRIELQEIESCLLNYDEIENAVVEVKDDGSEFLCAYIVCKNEINLKELKVYLREKLPLYMIPTTYITLDKLPLTPNGKIYRNKLPGVENKSVEMKEIIRPRNEIEKNLVEIFESVLNNEQISVNDNLFDIGVNSVMLIRVNSQVNILYNNKLLIVDYFTYPTIEKLSNYILNIDNEQTEEIEVIKLPDNYYNENNLGWKKEVYNFKFDEEKIKKLRSILNYINIKEFFLTIYLCLLYDLTEREEITVMFQDEFNDKLVPLKINSENIESVDELLNKIVNELHERTYNSKFAINSNIEIVINKTEREIVPLFYLENNNMKNKTNSYFDLMFGLFIQENNLEIILEYNSGKFKKLKMKELIIIYIKMVEAFINDKTN